MRMRGIVVGAGLMGGWHAQAVRRTGRTVAAIVDDDLSRAQAVARRYGARAARTLAEVFRDGTQAGTVVHICTPPASHHALAAIALEAGCHAIVEKPLAGSADEVATLLAHAHRVQRLLVPVHQYLFQAGVRDATRALPSLGAPLHVDTVVCTAGAEGRSDADRDRLVIEVLPHGLSLVARLVHPAVDEVDWLALRPRAGELRVAGTVAGATVGIVVSTHGRPTRSGMTIVCERGTVALDFYHGYATVVRGRATRGFKIAHPFVAAAQVLWSATVNLGGRALRAETAYPGLRELVRRTYDAAERGGAAPVAKEEVLAVARALDAVRQRVHECATPA
jgi:predicted dehydrogenase